MSNAKEIKSRIKSIKNTSKITKAMELISTVKMKKAQDSVLTLRPFALAVMEVLEKISHEHDILGFFWDSPDTDRELVVVIAAQKWLCGGYNVNTFKKVSQYIGESSQSDISNYDYIAIGRRARDFILRTWRHLLADFSDELDEPLEFAASRKVVRFLIEEWKSGKYSKISVVYNHYVSAISQLPVSKTIFPITKQYIEDFLKNILAEDYHDNKDSQESVEFTVEPNPEMILGHTLPMILDAIFHETLLEARAAEHAARMVAMKNAKDAANKTASSLTLVYNKARQSAITKEVSEIVSGVESMKDVND